MKELDFSTLQSLPKVELHLHLDCSLSYQVVRKLRPNISETTYQEMFIVPPKCKNLADFLKCTISGIELMQTPEELQSVVADLFDQLKKENVIYAEIRFAPLQHLNKGLTVEQVIETVCESVSLQSRNTGIDAGVILCTLRHFSEKESMQTIELIDRYKNNLNIVGFDIAADEAGFPVDAHKAAFNYAKEKGILRTAHAGEAKGPESVWETLTFFEPQRIGHGVRSIEDRKLIEHLIQNKIHLEICPTCNIQTDIYPSFADHPINELFSQSVSLGVNTDARSLVNVSLTDEYLKLHQNFNWGYNHFFQCNMNAVDAAFVNEQGKDRLRNKLVAGYKDIGGKTQKG
jgi:adenosine deaminase